MGKEHLINAEWTSGMAFDGHINGHIVTIDADAQFGGLDLGPRPKPLMLLALAGCTGMDVTSILKKMRVTYDHFRITVLGQTSDDVPVVYTSMHINYEFEGKDLPIDKIKHAIELSQTKYCGVTIMYKKIMPVTYSIYINGDILS